MGSFSPLNHLSGSRQRRANFTLFESQSFPESLTSHNNNRDPWPLAAFSGRCLYSQAAGQGCHRVPLSGVLWPLLTGSHRSQILQFQDPLSGGVYAVCQCLSYLTTDQTMQAGIWLQWEMYQIPKITCLRRQCIPVGRREIQAYSLFGYLRFKSGEFFFHYVFFLHGFSSNHFIICTMFYSENCELLMVLVTIKLNTSSQKWGHLMFPFPSARFHTVTAHQPRF